MTFLLLNPWIFFCWRKPGWNQVKTASVFNDSFKCRLLPINTYSCFELQLFVMEFTSPVLYAVVYRPPKYNKDFIHEFSADILPKYDKLLICGDFNVHTLDLVFTLSLSTRTSPRLTLLICLILPHNKHRYSHQFLWGLCSLFSVPWRCSLLRPHEHREATNPV